jgi:hypothetical protein
LLRQRRRAAAGNRDRAGDDGAKSVNQSHIFLTDYFDGNDGLSRGRWQGGAFSQIGKHGSLARAILRFRPVPDFADAATGVH